MVDVPFGQDLDRIASGSSGQKCPILGELSPIGGAFGHVGVILFAGERIAFEHG